MIKSMAPLRQKMKITRRHLLSDLSKPDVCKDFGMWFASGKFYNIRLTPYYKFVVWEFEKLNIKVS